MNASLGLYPKLLEQPEGWKQHFGRNRAVAFASALVTLFMNYQSLRIEIEVQGAQRKVRTPTLFLGNNALQMEQLGFSLADAIDDGELAGILMRPTSRWAMLGLLLRGVFGRLGDTEQLLSFSFRRLAVRTAWPLHARRIKVARDGEERWLSLPLVFRVSPQPLRLIRPAGPAPERQAA